jgi:hypothetical protein
MIDPPLVYRDAALAQKMRIGNEQHAKPSLASQRGGTLCHSPRRVGAVFRAGRQATCQEIRMCWDLLRPRAPKCMPFKASN